MRNSIYIFVLVLGGINGLAYQLLESNLSLLLLFISLSLYFYKQLKLSSLKEALVIGFLFGVGQFTIGLSWIAEILDDYYSDNTSFLALTLVGIVIVLSLFNAFSSACLYFLLKNSKHVFQLLLPASSLVFIDWARELGDMGFPWLQPSALLIDSFLSGWFSIIGGLGVNFIFYLLITCFSFLFIHRGKYYLSVGLIVTIVVTSLSVLNLNWTVFKSSVDIRIIHGNFSNRDKLSRNETIDRFEKFTSLSLQYPKVKLVVWPESSVSLPFQSIEKFIITSIDLLSKNDVSVLYGSSWYKGTEIINVLMDSRQDKPIYTKQKLVPFGEYRPQWFSSLFTSVPLSRGDEMTSAVQHSQPISVNGIKLASAVCFEALFSTTYIDQLNTSDAGIAVLISDLEWNPGQWIPRYLLSISRVRAMEIERPFIYSTNHGISAFINSKGQIVNQSSNLNRTQKLDYSVTPSFGFTPYTHWGNVPLITFILIIVGMTAWYNLFSVFNKQLQKMWKFKYEY